MAHALYQNVEILNRDQHANLRLKPATDMRYAALLRDCPIVVDEFSEAAKTYPIVFSHDREGHAMALVVMGFPGSGNVWLDEAGCWLPVNYVPAYVRRYPFAAIERDGEFFLGLDMAFPGVNTADGQALFDAEGQPGPLLGQASAFVDQFVQGHARTQAFLGELERLELLRPFDAEIWVEGETAAALVDLRCIDAKRLDDLPACALIDFVRQGHYALAIAHLASLSNFRHITARLTGTAKA